MFSRGTPPRCRELSACAGGRIDGARTAGNARSSRKPLNTASRSKPSSVIPPYSISASTTGSTHVAFGFVMGSDHPISNKGPPFHKRGDPDERCKRPVGQDRIGRCSRVPFENNQRGAFRFDQDQLGRAAA